MSGAQGRGGLGRLLRAPLDDSVAAVQALAQGPGSGWRLLLAAASLLLCWLVYVPLHELLHVAGCVASGGRVSELQLDPVYGAAWLARVFPFVVPGGDYAGRLSGFDTGGSDAVYLATVLAPYLPSVWPGVALLRLCARSARPALLGAALVLALAPFYNVAGDYYELGSILVTRAAGLAAGGGALHAELRSDDLPRLLGQLSSDPQSLGLAGPAAVALAALLVALGTALSLLLALLSYAAGARLARLRG